MARPAVEVQTVIRTGELGFFDGWVQCLATSVRNGRRGQLLGETEVVIGDATGSAEDRSRRRPDDEQRLWPGDFRVHRLAPATGKPAGHNELFDAGGTPDLILLVDPSAYLSPTCVHELVASMADPAVGLAEARQLPLERRRTYDLMYGDTSWASSTCCLIRREVLAQIGGFDVTSFPAEGADVDLSWRARLAGWRVRYVPWATVFVHADVGVNDELASGGPDGRADEARLLLACKYAGPELAHAWALAWAHRGSDDERAAAEQFEDKRAAGRIPERAGGATAELVPEVFSLGSLARPADELEVSGPADESSIPASAAAEPARPREPTDLEAGDSAAPFLTVIVRTQGRRLAALEENLLSLAAQTCGDFEVLLVGHDVDAPQAVAVGSVVEAFADDFVSRIRRLEVSGGGRSRPLNVALGEAHGHYAAFLDDDDVAFGDWVAMFRQVARMHPGAVIWTQVAGQPVDSVTCAGRVVMRADEPPEVFTETFNILPHLCQNQTPNCGLAIPVSCFREQGARYREDLPVLEDWDMVLQVAQLRPVEVTGRVTALYRRGDSNNSSTVHTHDDWDEAEAAVLGALENSSFVLRGEFLPEIRETMDDLESLRLDAEASGEQIESLSEQVADLERRLAAALSGSSSGAISGLATGPVGAAARPLIAAEQGSDLIDELKERTVIVISTHMDDGVLSCGDLIWQVPQCVVLTVFAGDDVDWSRLHEWDEGCGFSAGTNVTAVRVAEDERALALLGSTGLRLAFLDEQYRRPGIAPTIEEVSGAILAAIDKIGAETILFPLGLGHDDHRLTAGGAAHAARRTPHLNWFAYEDLPYGYEDEAEVEEALAALADMTPTAVELGTDSDLERKDAAIDLYRSQMIALQEDRWVLALQPERYWALTAGRT